MFVDPSQRRNRAISSRQMEHKKSEAGSVGPSEPADVLAKRRGLHRECSPCPGARQF